MREHLRHARVATVATFVLACAAPAAAEGIKSVVDKPVDLEPVRANLDVYRDEFGMYYVSPKANAFAAGDEAHQYLFYGDTKSMYRQHVISHSMIKGQYGWTMWSPRVKGMPAAQIELDRDVLSVICEMRDRKYVRRKLVELPADQAKIFLERATFYPPLWKREAHFLARDDDGAYYYVDKLTSDFGGAGFRLYVGQKGVLKELVITNTASDSAGEIYATKAGSLKIVKKDGTASWKKGDKLTELVVVPPRENRYLIYRELGIYGRLGVVCDEL